MEKICVKCGYVNTLKSFDASSECPRCGVIYAKAEAAKEERIKQEEKKQPESPESPSSGGRNVVSLLVLGGLACLIFYYYWGNAAANKHEKQVVASIVKQKFTPKPIRMVQRRPLLTRLNPVRKEKEVEENGIQGNNDAASREARKNITIVKKIGKKTVRYYLAESTISQGEKVSLQEHMSKGRFTVFFFFAHW